MEDICVVVEKLEVDKLELEDMVVVMAYALV